MFLLQLQLISIPCLLWMILSYKHNTNWRQTIRICSMKVDGYESRLIFLFNFESQEFFIIELVAFLEPFYYTPERQ